MSKKYNIIWLDDEHEELGGFKMQASQNDILLQGYKSLESWISEIERNYNNYDGILLDAKFFEKETDRSGTEDVSNLIRAKELLLQIPVRFEVFILTGQSELIADRTFNSFFPKFYRKGIPEDIINLFKDIKFSADQLFNTQLRHNYPEAFRPFSERIIDECYLYNVIEMLKCLEIEDYKKKNLNVIRDVLESVFHTLIKKYNSIPDSFLLRNNQPNLEWCTRYLEGKETTDGSRITHNIRQYNLSVPEEIAVSIRYVKESSSAYSHLSDDEFVKNAFISTSYAMISILAWLPGFIEENYDH